VLLGLFLGGASSATVVVWLIQGDWRWAFLAMRVGFWGFLLPVYGSIAHRMIPFLTGNQLRHPRALLHGFVLLCIVRLALELRHAYHLLWLADIPLLMLVSWAGWRWRCWRSRGNPLAAGLCIAWAMLWLGLAFGVFQDLQLARTGGFVLGRAPQHLIGIGFFGAMLVTTTTRKLLDENRYRRPLVLSALIAIGGSCLAALLRAGAELAVVQAPSLMAISAGLWIVSVLPWCLVVAAIVLRAGPARERNRG
ncbi:MAG: NnrS family protein, partial [Xanthomonadales bacterium]|nr:NnrS family protein [Xanthomonadales bacterium]